MKVLKKIKLEDLLVLDIETSYNTKELVEGTPLYEAFKYKYPELNKKDLCEKFKDEGALFAEFGRIVCISIGRLHNGKFVTTTYNDLCEETLIKNFYKTLDKSDFVLCGHSIKNFDIPFIFKRSVLLGIPPHPLVDTSGEKPWTMDWILDTKELFQAGSFAGTSLIAITASMGIPTPKDGITGKEVPRYYWKDPAGNIAEISEYCEKDIVATYRVIERFKNIRATSLQDYGEISVEVVEEAADSLEQDLLQELFDGARYTPKIKESLKEKITALPEELREFAFTVLEATTSTAAGKKTKFTKAHVKILKAEINGK